jgi:hypothetical protein
MRTLSRSRAITQFQISVISEIGSKFSSPDIRDHPRESAVKIPHQCYQCKSMVRFSIQTAS